MYPSKPNPREYLRQAIDAEIKSLEESTRESTGIRSLRQRRNALAPVSSLPTEVITAIFSFLSLPGTPQLGKKPAHPLPWLHGAYVCHQWREIALDLTFFWSHVDLTNLTLSGATDILARAKKAPLHLAARLLSRYWSDARFSAFKKELQSRVSYIHHLTLSVDHSSRLRKMLESPAPTLEYLSLSRPGQLVVFGTLLLALLP
jgi:hypothetical protein